MRIRERSEADFETCLEVARGVKAADDYPPRGEIDADWFLAPPESLAAWVAEEDGAVVGHVALHAASDYVATRLLRDRFGCSLDQLGLVARLFVDPAQRGSGVGRALLDHVSGAAVARGLRPVLDVATHLTGAVALYEACGWTRIGEVVLDGWKGEGFGPPLPLYVYAGPAGSGG